MKNNIAFLALSIFLISVSGCFKPAVCPRCLQPTDTIYVEAVDKPTAVAVGSGCDRSIQTTSFDSSEKDKQSELVRFVLNYKDIVAYVVISILSMIVVSKTGSTPVLLSKLSTHIYDKCSASKRKIINVVNALLRRHK
jgi:hypothetical protein